MKKLIFAFTLSVSASAFAAVDREPTSSQPITVVTVRGASGEMITIKSDDEKYMSQAPDIRGVAYSSSPRLCEDDQKGSRTKVRAFEVELELNLLAETLSEAPDRKLSESQLRRLNRIPDCREFRPLLHAVSLVLKNENTKYQGYQVLEAN